ncbi:MAG TPA: hypothetical protein VLB12_12470 [Gemmatimonadales bacterium]|nr:hypothetical protein [Gemmatimonadales bacterium]
MIELTGDIWEAHALGHWIAITTNPIVNARGELVMGRGVAKQAADRCPGLSKTLGQWATTVGGFYPASVPEHRIITFPVKRHWRERAVPWLIGQSARQVKALVFGLQSTFPRILPLYMVRPGCGNGGLEWKDVRPLLAPIFDSVDFIVVERGDE